MATTTIRVDVETHESLVALSREANATIMETVREAVDALRRQRLAGQVAQEMAALRADPAGWADYLADAESTAVTDGVGR